MDNNSLFLGYNGYLGCIFGNYLFKYEKNIIFYDKNNLNIDNIIDIIKSNNIKIIYNFLQKRNCDNSNLKRFLDSQVIFFKKIIKICKNYNIKLVYPSSYAVICDIAKDRFELIYKKIKEQQEKLVINNLDNYLILRFPSIYNYIMPKDMLLYRMTWEENFELTNYNLIYEILSEYKLQSYLYNNNILEKNKEIITLPSDKYTLLEIYNLCKNNYFEIEK
jgi:dTDP-4-dehydrorhamnose reductase